MEMALILIDVEYMVVMIIEMTIKPIKLFNNNNNNDDQNIITFIFIINVLFVIITIVFLPFSWISLGKFDHLFPNHFLIILFDLV